MLYFMIKLVDNFILDEFFYFLGIDNDEIRKLIFKTKNTYEIFSKIKNFYKTENIKFHARERTNETKFEIA